MTKAQTSARNVVASLLDKNFESLGQNLADAGLQAHEDNLDCDTDASTARENFSVFTLTDDQSPPIDWLEPKRGRKIQTTSLLLKRKKKDKGKVQKKKLKKKPNKC